MFVAFLADAVTSVYLPHCHIALELTSQRANVTKTMCPFTELASACSHSVRSYSRKCLSAARIRELELKKTKMCHLLEKFEEVQLLASNQEGTGTA